MTDIDKTGLVSYQGILELIKERGTAQREEAVTLSGGAQTDVYLDIKNVLDSGRFLARAGLAYMEWFGAVTTAGVVAMNDVNALGGPTMGADCLSHSLVVMSAFAIGAIGKKGTVPDEYLQELDKKWFSVRSQPKLDHGLGRWIEGTTLGSDDICVLVDDVASTGKSLFDAWLRVSETGAEVRAVMPLVDRSDKAAKLFAPHGVPYLPLVTYQELGIPPL